ncbi:LPD29 domain-containing protein [Brevibacillus laterosporus]|uniref:LPD29 domain-containing protein n=1 Tax=Brevibacillus laterosporus TaxID=1465 RepID=UPI003D1DAF80
METTALKINEELNGIELYFNSKPVQKVIYNLKENGFRWSGFKKCWYAKQSERAFQIARSLANDSEQVAMSTEKVVKKTKTKNNNISLWDSTRWTDIEVNKEQYTKEMAKEIRTHVRKRFPQCKFSVKSDYNSINFYIVSSPYEEESEYLKAIWGYCSELLMHIIIAQIMIHMVTMEVVIIFTVLSLFIGITHKQKQQRNKRKT